MNYWLMKSEPNVFSIQNLESKFPKAEFWEGVRNFQARNYMRAMKAGDLAFFYHSNAKPSGIVGVMRITQEAHPDPSAWDKGSPYYYFRSTPGNPIWMGVSVEWVQTFSHIISLQALKQDTFLSKMPLFQKGSRLSVMPVSVSEWEGVFRLL